MSLLSSQAIKDTFTYGAKAAGVTIHFADEKMDHGPIILQEAFKISEKETLESLEERVHTIEHKLYPKAISLFIEGRLKIKGRRVHILEKPAGKEPPDDRAEPPSPENLI